MLSRSTLVMHRTLVFPGEEKRSLLSNPTMSVNFVSVRIRSGKGSTRASNDNIMEKAITNLINLKQVCALMLKPYAPVEGSYRKIAKLRPWSLLLTGNQETLQAEDRCGETIRKLSRHLPKNHQHVKIARQLGKGADGRFIFDRDGKTEEASAQDFHGGFEKIAEQALSQRARQRAHDITSLELDAILHIQHFLINSTILTCLRCTLLQKNIAAEMSTNCDSTRLHSLPATSPCTWMNHLLIPTFLCWDSTTAGPCASLTCSMNGKIMKNTPSSVTHLTFLPGLRLPEKQIRGLKFLKPEQIFKISGFEPLRVCEKLQELYQSEGRLDIIPLGPKLMLLGATRFYFSLNEKERNNVRILYDFPQSTTGATSGVLKHYLFPCSGS